MAAIPGAGMASSNIRTGSMMMMGASEVPQEAEVRETVRKYFPETWIWDMVPLE